MMKSAIIFLLLIAILSVQPAFGAQPGGIGKNRIMMPVQTGDESTTPAPSGIGRKKTPQQAVNKIILHANAMLARASFAITRIDVLWERHANGAAKPAAVISARQAAMTAIEQAKAAVAALQGTTDKKAAIQTFLTAFEKVRTTRVAYHKSVIEHKPIGSVTPAPDSSPSATPVALPTTNISPTGV